MTAPLLRTPLLLAFTRCLRVAGLPVLGTALLGFVMGRWLLAPIEGVDAAPGAGTPWLHLPLLTAAVACAMATASFWPMFAARRPGADWVARLQRGPLRGNGAAITGALLAQFCLSAPVVLVLPVLLGAPAEATAFVVFTSPPDALLVAPRQSLRFPAPAGLSAVEVQLRPLAAAPTGPLQPSRIEVLADGDPLPANDVAIDQTGQLIRLHFAARTITELHIVLVSGNVPLVFPNGSVTAVCTGSHSGAGNGLLVASAYLLPSFVALAIACLCGSAAALPTVLGVLGCLLFVQTLGGAGPADDALRALLRGHWLPSRIGFSQCLPSLAAGSVAMILAMVLQRKPR